MENQAIASNPASRVTKLKLRVTREPKARLQTRGGARGQKERVQTYDEVDTCNLKLHIIYILRLMSYQRP